MPTNVELNFDYHCPICQDTQPHLPMLGEGQHRGWMLVCRTCRHVKALDAKEAARLQYHISQLNQHPALSLVQKDLNDQLEQMAKLIATAAEVHAATDAAMRAANDEMAERNQRMAVRIEELNKKINDLEKEAANIKMNVQASLGEHDRQLDKLKNQSKEVVESFTRHRQLTSPKILSRRLGQFLYGAMGIGMLLSAIAFSFPEYAVPTFAAFAVGTGVYSIISHFAAMAGFPLGGGGKWETFQDPAPRELHQQAAERPDQYRPAQYVKPGFEPTPASVMDRFKEHYPHLSKMLPDQTVPPSPFNLSPENKPS